MNDLKARFAVQALIRRAESGGAAGFVVRSGDPDAGEVLVKVATLDGMARLYAPSRDAEGGRLWIQPMGDEAVPEREADAWASRRAESDPDLWLVEIEDRLGRHFLTEAVE